VIKGLDNYVTLEPVTHTYKDRDGRTYMSVSKFRERFKKPFDKSIAYSCAGKGDYKGMTAAQVLKQWDTYRDDRAGKGTQAHDALERFEKTTIIKEEDEFLRPAILSIASEYNDYFRIYQEQVLYCTDTMLAGTADKILLTSSHKDAVVDFTDYKTNAKGVHVKDFDKHGKPVHKYFTGILSHMLESKYSDYALQLSIYAYMFEKATGRKVGSLRIHFIPLDNPLAHYFIPVPYMRETVIAMFEWHKANPITTIITQPDFENA
jgi:hypothetical protein